MKKLIMCFLAVLMFFSQPVFADGVKTKYTEEYSLFLSQIAEGDGKWLLSATLLSLILLVLVGVLVIKIKHIRREKEEDKLVDAETGMGNLQFFKSHFMNITDDDFRNMYNIAYIVLDSSYLRSYYDGSSFGDVLEHAVAVFSEETKEKEAAARIAENGFVFAFRAEGEENAKKRIINLMKKLNNFEGVKGNKKIVFHCATYHLQKADDNCELVLFNLRRNCNKIIGTDKQIVYCDTRSMNKVQEEKEFTESIIKGLENEEFKMYFQFVVDNKTKKVVSAEALSRWNNGEKGLLAPGQYIEKMEQSGLISKHDFHMFELACRQLEKWSGTEYDNISISCNFTRSTLSEPIFIDRLKTISGKYKFDKSKLAIEITEDVMEKDRELATENVKLCKELGFKVYLDDLGSGYTSLSNLCDYPIDIVKIDRDILLKTDSKRGKELFSGIIALAHSLNMHVICEGVETEKQNAFVSETDCDFVQGWYYSKPSPAENCENLM